MNWIKLRTDIFDDPAVENMALDLGTNTRQIVGQLSDIWGWVGRHTTDGVCPNVSPALIDARLQCPGFAQAMIDQGWLETAEKGVKFPKWDRHNSSSAKARALEAEAKQLRRNMSDKCPTNKPVNVRPEKRREEKSNNTPPPPKGMESSTPKESQSHEVDSFELKDESASAKKEKGGRKRNELLDALVAATGTTDLQMVTGPMWAEAANALKIIREVEPEVSPDGIRRAAVAYRDEWPTASLSPSALAKHWGKFRPAEKKPNGEAAGKYSLPPCNDWRGRFAYDDSTQWTEIPLNLRRNMHVDYSNSDPLP